MNCSISILNEAYSADNEFILCQMNGDAEHLPQRIQEKMTVEQWVQSDGGDWVMLIDGVVEVTGTSHPFLIQCFDEDEEDETAGVTL